MLKNIIEHKITLIISAIVFACATTIAIYFLYPTQKHNLSNTVVKVMTINKNISADGKIDSDKHVSLSFAKGGTVTSIAVKVGDSVSAGKILATIDPKQLSASLSSAQADVLSAKANLTALEKGATPQTRAIYDQNISTTKLALSTAMRDAYLKIQDVLLNKINIFFDNNISVNPTIKISTESQDIKDNINNERLVLTEQMAIWNSSLQTNPSGDDTISKSTKNIALAKNFIDSLSSIINRLNTGTSGYTQSTIDSYTAIMTSASLVINSAETGFNASLQAYKSATDQLDLIQASSTPEALSVAQANLLKAEANVNSIYSQIKDTTLIAPFDGIVASVNPKTGQDFPANTPAIDIISPGAFKIDVMIPENEVAAVLVGNDAVINFSNYGDIIVATGTVSSIDLAETITNGVGAYKATIYINSPDPRIRTGMTADVNIIGISVENTLAIPNSAIIAKSDGNYVLVAKDQNQYIEKKIETGISDGHFTEIKSGINSGDVVATFGDSNL